MTCSASICRPLCTLAAIATLAGCQSARVGSDSEHGPVHAPAHWGYEGEIGPSAWAALNPDYALCAAGQCQSPIDIIAPQGRDLPNIDFEYHPSAINIVNNGHTIQVNYDAGSFVEIDGRRFDLVQLHFHAPSEHRIDGRAFPAEMHMVHRADDGELAVVAVFIKEGAGNPAFDAAWSQLPESPGPARLAEGRINAGDLLPDVRTTFRYGGSLTTPPCSENVNWNLLITPVEMSPGQIAAFTRLHSGNNRPVQPANGRVVIEDQTP